MIVIVCKCAARWLRGAANSLHFAITACVEQSVVGVWVLSKGMGEDSVGVAALCGEVAKA